MNSRSKTLADIEKRFREGGNLNSDLPILKQLILRSDDVSELESAIQMFGRHSALDAEVIELCMGYIIDTPEPGLTAVCMRTAFDYWGRWEDSKVLLAAYLDIGRCDDWYDEVLFAGRFCAALSRSRATRFFNLRLTALREASLERKKIDLFELIDIAH